ncbi:hypothetical protein EJB05_40617, partial [Eragrostis curvula]
MDSNQSAPDAVPNEKKSAPDAVPNEKKSAPDAVPKGKMSALNAKHYIVAALTATLAVAVVVTIFFVVLSPARIKFSIAKAGSSHKPGDGNLVLTLTIAAVNPSGRAAVRYESMFVDVSNNTEPPINWIRATVTTGLPLRQPRASVATVDATVTLVRSPWMKAFTGNMTNNLTVIITTVARFKVGIAQTRLYDIKVTCGPVGFFPGTADGPPVDCA